MRFVAFGGCETAEDLFVLAQYRGGPLALASSLISTRELVAADATFVFGEGCFDLRDRPLRTARFQKRFSQSGVSGQEFVIQPDGFFEVGQGLGRLASAVQGQSTQVVQFRRGGRSGQQVFEQRKGGSAIVAVTKREGQPPLEVAVSRCERESRLPVQRGFPVACGSLMGFRGGLVAFTRGR